MKRHGTPLPQPPPPCSSYDHSTEYVYHHSYGYNNEPEEEEEGIMNQSYDYGDDENGDCHHDQSVYGNLHSRQEEDNHLEEDEDVSLSHFYQIQHSEEQDDNDDNDDLISPPLIEDEDDDEIIASNRHVHSFHHQHHQQSIVRNIASFLTLSDVASMASSTIGGDGGGESSTESLAMGLEGWTTSVMNVFTPPTPAIVAVSPTVFSNPDVNVSKNDDDIIVPELQGLDSPDEDDDDEADHDDDNNDDSDDDDCIPWEDRLRQRRRKWAQERLAASVFSHPRPLRSYCLEAYEAAKSIRQQHHQQQQHANRKPTSFSTEQYHGQPEPETLREPWCLEQYKTSSPAAPALHRRLRRRKKRGTFHRRVNILLIPIEMILSSLPVSVLLDVLEFVMETTKDSSFATLKITISTIDTLISTLLDVMKTIWTAITNFHPLDLLDALISIQFNAMEKTSEVIVSGIQSVATGMGSAGHFALQRLSRAGGGAGTSSGSHAGGHYPFSSTSQHRTESLSAVLSIHGDGGGGGSSSGGGGLRRSRSSSTSNKNVMMVVNKKLLRKLSSINSAAEVVSYLEHKDDTGGLSKEAKKRVQRMMHYDVSLRPFVATVVLPPPPPPPPLVLESKRRDSQTPPPQHQQQLPEEDRMLMTTFENVDFPTHSFLDMPPATTTTMDDTTDRTYDRRSKNDVVVNIENNDQALLPPPPPQPEVAVATVSPLLRSSPSSSSTTTSSSLGDDDGGSPFMCTPQSFPPTPASRRMVMARGSRYADDVVFLARDQLRVHDALESENERTRAMANALRDGKRLAVFNADDAAHGIALTCGQHVATKVGNMVYCTTRSMVPVLRNCFVYFEVTVMPRTTTTSTTTTTSGTTTTTTTTTTSSTGNEFGHHHHPVATALLGTTLAIGLSTLEMPLNTVVGAWKGSVGLCTTGQILTAGQWCSPMDPNQCAYGESATIGCLVCLDDGTAFETWEGIMVTAAVTFSVNGRLVSPPVSSMPMIGSVGTTATADYGASTTHRVPTMNHHSWLDPTIEQRYPRLLPAPPAALSTLPLLVPADEELYATVSLHSPATSVMCRFSAEDVLATDRTNIGAPRGVTVYAIDGSVIFEHS